VSHFKTPVETLPAPARPSAPPRGLRARLHAWIHGPTLGRDLVIVLCIKLALLMLLKHMFFDHPLAEHMSMPPAAVAAHMLSVPAADSTQRVRHDQ
jgi:hypothetical protein